MRILLTTSQKMEDGQSTPDGVDRHDPLPRHSDSSQTWSSENDSSDLEGSEKTQFQTPPNLEQEEEEEQGS